MAILTYVNKSGCTHLSLISSYLRIILGKTKCSNPLFFVEENCVTSEILYISGNI